VTLHAACRCLRWLGCSALGTAHRSWWSLILTGAQRE